jgi:hypothetical protein
VNEDFWGEKDISSEPVGDSCLLSGTTSVVNEDLRGEKGISSEPMEDICFLSGTTSDVNVELQGDKGISSEPVEDSYFFPGFRDPELGESSIGVVLESLVPSYKETLSPTPIPTYQGMYVVSRVRTSGDTSLIEGIGEGTGKDYTWLRVLGYDISPIKTRSACKKAITIPTTPNLFFSNIYDNGVLRGMKALAREKS